MGRMPETGLTPAELREFPRYALARILMHAVKTEPARFWRVFGQVCCHRFTCQKRAGSVFTACMSMRASA
ncbi:hypothetical protein CSC93_27190 [Klebsiella pneumoniae]|nr:hypothetical protein CSC93_27190 [Klebsiella pneumoniae]